MVDQSKVKKELTPEQYNVCFLKGTEAPGSGKYDKHYEKGMYNCAVCGEVLFSSATKFDSKTGWPSFFDSFDPGKIKLEDDYALGMARTEATCANCGSHLGHVFDDGPEPTGKRYCINSLSLDFVPEKKS